jgi:hypothetical protein
LDVTRSAQTTCGFDWQVFCIASSSAGASTNVATGTKTRAAAEQVTQLECFDSDLGFSRFGLALSVEQPSLCTFGPQQQVSDEAVAEGAAQAWWGIAPLSHTA